MAICGPKLSLCCLLLSVWGLIQLSLMGIFFFIQSVAFVEDLPVKEPKDYPSVGEFLNEAERAYGQSAYNCWIAACLYLGTLLISGHQYWMNTKTVSSF